MFLGARSGGALQSCEPLARADVATDAEVDSIVQAVRMKSETESGLLLCSIH